MPSDTARTRARRKRQMPWIGLHRPSIKILAFGQCASRAALKARKAAAHAENFPPEAAQINVFANGG